MAGTGNKDKAGAGENTARVFISYSRSDQEFAEHLLQGLERRDIAAYLDRKDIVPGEPWQDRLASLIAGADAIVFIVTPASVTSDICRWEVEEAERLSKRIVPIVLRDVADADMPPLLARRNYIRFVDPEEVPTSFEALVDAVKTDIAWVREHTRLGELAARWDKQGRARGALLRGQDLQTAETWLSNGAGKAPAASPLHNAFIAESRVALARRQRLTLGGAIAVAAVTLVLAGIAYFQRNEAQNQQALAEKNRDEAVQSQSRLLADRSMRATESGNAATGLLLAIEAAGDVEAGSDQRIEPQAREALYQAVLQRRHLKTINRIDPDELAKIIGRLVGKMLPKLPEKKTGDVSNNPPSGELFGDIETLAELRTAFPDDTQMLVSAFIRSAALSEDGTELAADFASGEVVIWDVATGKEKWSATCAPPAPNTLVASIAQMRSWVWFDESRGIRVKREDSVAVRPQQSDADGETSRSTATVVTQCFLNRDKSGRVLTVAPSRITVSDIQTGKNLISAPNSDEFPNRTVFEQFEQYDKRSIHFTIGKSKAQLWDLENGKILRVLSFPKGLGLTDHGLSAHERKIFCLGGKIFEFESGKQIQDLTRADSETHRCLIHAKGKRVMTNALSRSGTTWFTRIWDLESGKLLYTFTEPTEKLDYLESILDPNVWMGPPSGFGSGGDYIWFEDENRRPSLYSVEDGRVLASAKMVDEKFEQFEDLDELKKRYETTQNVDEPGYAKIVDRINSFGGTSDGEFVLAHTYDQHPKQLALSRLGTSKGFSRIQIWDVASERLVDDLGEVEGEIRSLYFSKDGKRLHAYVETSNFLQLWVWGIVPRKRKTFLDGVQTNPAATEGNWALLLDLSGPDGILRLQRNYSRASERARMAVLDHRGFSVSIWNLDPIGAGAKGFKAVTEPGEYGFPDISLAAFTSNGDNLTVTLDGKPFVFDPATGKLTEADVSNRAEGAIPAHVSALPIANPDLFAIGCTPLMAWGANADKAWPLPNKISCEARDFAGDKVIARVGSGAVAIHDLTSGKLHAEIRVPRKADTPRDQLRLLENVYPVAKLSPSGRLVAIAGETGGLWLHKADDGVLVHEFRKVGFPVQGLKFSLDETRLIAISGGSDGDIWNVETGKRVAALQTPKQRNFDPKAVANAGVRVHDVAFSPDGQHVAAALEDATARVWLAETGDLVAILAGHASTVKSIAFHPDGRKIATVGNDGTVQYWSFFPKDDQLVAFAKDAARNCLSPRQRRDNFLGEDIPAWCGALGKSTRDPFAIVEELRKMAPHF